MELHHAFTCDVRFVAAVSCLLASHTFADELVLADGGRSDYQIVLADNASPSTRHGAEELQTFLEQISGVKLPIVSDQKPMGPHEIILGDNAHLRTLGVNSISSRSVRKDTSFAPWASVW